MSTASEEPDPRARFGAVVADLHPRLFTLALGITGNRAAAEDAVAAAYAGAWSRYRHGGIAMLDRYLWRSVARQARRTAWLRRRRDPGQSAPPLPDDPADVVAADMDLARLLLRIPTNQRTVVALRYVVGLSEAETAELLGIAPGTVKSRLSRAAESLRRQIGDRPGTSAHEMPINLPELSCD